MKNSMQREVGETYMTFDYLYKFLLKAMPVLIILESVKEIFSTELGESSDGEFVLSQLRLAGYVVSTYITSKAHELGSLPTRIRVYFLGMRVPKAIADSPAKIQELTEDIRSFSSNMTAEPDHIDTYLLPHLLTDDSIQDDAGEKPAKAPRAALGYKDDHFMIYRKAGFRWPAPSDDHIASVIDTAGMSDQVREIAYYVHAFYEESQCLRARVRPISR